MGIAKRKRFVILDRLTTVKAVLLLMLFMLLTLAVFGWMVTTGAQL